MLQILEAVTATEAFEKAYKNIDFLGEIVESRIGKTKHLTNVTICLDRPQCGVCLDPVRNLSLKYLLAELRWYMSGSNKVEDIAPYAKMWYNLTDDGTTLNSAYGYRIQKMFNFDQLKYCIEKLKQNPYDRQAVIHIKTPSDAPTKDTPCTCLIQFTCFHGTLEAHVYMRSNDVWLGLPYDMAYFTYLQQVVAKEIGMPLGKYYHTVGDMHIYERHWNKPVRITTGYREDNLTWDASSVTEEELTKYIENGECPSNEALAELWRMNHGQHQKD